MLVGLDIRVEAVSVEVSQVEMSAGALYASFFFGDICRSLAIIVILKGSIKFLLEPTCADAALASWMGMPSQTVAVEGAFTEEICAATEILFVSNFICIPLGVLIMGEERRCISLLRFGVPIIIIDVGWWGFAFSRVSHHGYNIFCDGCDGTLELSIARTQDLFVLDVSQIHEVLTV